jgi:selenocysteine-specific elongation factor
VLSTELSTAALDKAPQSAQRGITLDLGFSAFCLAAPAHLASSFSLVRFTLVDCPGHASLLRTMIGGAAIMDVMLLVIDATKGIQTQTAECLVLGEMLVQQLLIVVNKADLLQAEKDRAKLERGLRASARLLAQRSSRPPPPCSLCSPPR